MKSVSRFEILDGTMELKKTNAMQQLHFVLLIIPKFRPGFQWFDLVSLFNGVSIFVGYLLPNPSF